MLKKIKLSPYYIRLKKIKKYISHYNKCSTNELLDELPNVSENKKIAIVYHLIHHVKQLYLHDEQLIAIMALLDGKFADIKTGEGKTIIVTAYCLIATKPIHVVTVNEYLAEYAEKEMQDLYTLCGITTGVLYEQAEKNVTNIFQSDIVYGTANAYCFKHVIDRFSRKIDYELHTAVVDEADYVLIDNATSACSVGIDEFIPINSEQMTLHIAKRIMQYLSECNVFAITYDEELFWGQIKSRVKFERTIFIHKERKFIDLSQDIIDAIYEIDTGGIYDGPELISFAIGLTTALYAYEKMVDYIVEDEKIILIDSHNGRRLPNSKHDFYLDIGLRIKEHIHCVEEHKNIGSIATQPYFMKYKKIIGLSGSLEPVKEEIFDRFKAKTAIIPKHIQNKIYTQSIFCQSLTDKYNELLEIIKKETEQNRPVLIIAKDDAFAKKIGEYLIPLFDNISIFNNEQSYMEEQRFVNEAGEPKKITVSTMLFGRGIDITPKNDSELVVIMFEDYGCERLKLQIAGRSGRQGKIGRVYTLISPDDMIFQNLSTKELKQLNKYTFRRYTKKAVNRIQSINYGMREYSTYFELYFDMIFDYYYHHVQSAAFDDYFLAEMERIRLYRYSNQQREEASLEIMREAEKIINTILYNLGGGIKHA